jgi:hypothetical protein
MTKPSHLAETVSKVAAGLTRRRVLLAAGGGLGAALVAGPVLDRLAPSLATDADQGIEPALAMEEEPLPHEVHVASAQLPALAPLPPHHATQANAAILPDPVIASPSEPIADDVPIWEPPAPVHMPPAPAPPAVAAQTAPPTPTPSIPAAPADASVWLRNARPYVDTGAVPAVAVVIDDLGLGAAATRRALALDSAVTLALMTYAPRVGEWSRAARTARHEVLVHVPMQPINAKIDAGPKALTVALSAPEIRDRLRWGLDRLDGYVGINNHMGSRFTQDRAGMEVVMEEVKARGLLFLDSVTIAHTVGPATAVPLGVPCAERNVFLDDVPTVAGVSQQIAVLERVARRHGTAIAIGHPHPATLSVLAAWLPGAAARGIVVVPLTSVMRRQALRA